jgi:predicted house-cleaning NTP pyrophosphatase (Maf/HAM1 superfamily)
VGALVGFTPDIALSIQPKASKSQIALQPRSHLLYMNDEEIADYVASGEPLHVAGGFTLDGFGSPFIPVIEGDYTNVVGLSMPFLLKAMKQLGYSWPAVKKMGA